MKSIKIFSILLILGLMMVACETLLEPENDNQYEMDRILKDPAFAEGLLVSAYKSLPNAYNLDEVATDNAVSNDKSNSFLRMATGEWTASFSPVSKWSTAYDAIFKLNFFLSVVDNVDWYYLDNDIAENFARRFKGEALALRGYFYNQLLVNHGGVATDDNLLGVPLVTEVLESDDNWKIPRSTYLECVDRINDDYDEAISLLPAEWADDPDDKDYNKVFGAQNKNRINATYVRALKSRLALHIASPALNAGTYDAAKCITAATLAGQLLQENGGITGMSTDNVGFYNEDGDISNADILWRNDYYMSNVLESDNAPPSLYGNGRVNPTQNLVNAFPMLTGYPIDHELSGYNPDRPYADRDPRLNYYILCDSGNYGGNDIYTDLNSPTDGLNRTTSSTRTGYYLLKLMRTDVNLNPATTTTKRHFFTHIRWTELYLNYAEAANEAWGPDGDGGTGYGTARDVIGQLRSIAGITPDVYLAGIVTREDMRELIRNERRIALCFEGFRFWDLRRWGVSLTETAKGVSITPGNYSYIDVENRVYPDYAVYGPVPYDEVIKYSGLLQNKGW